MSHHLMVLVHDFATIIWMGGMFVYIVIFLPLIQANITANKERKLLMQQIIKKMSKWMVLSSILITVSGLVLIPKNADGVYLFLRWLDLYSILLSVKIILSAFMFVLIYLKLKKIDHISKPETRKKWIYRVISTNIFLGVLVITLSIIIRGYNPTL